MKLLITLLQIDELFKGHVNPRGVLQLVIFLAALAVIISFSIFIGLKAFKAKK